MLKNSASYFIGYVILSMGSASTHALELLSSNQPQISFLVGAGSTEKIQRILGDQKLVSPISYFTGVGYRSDYFGKTPIKLESQILKHFKKQSAIELVFCPVLETPKFIFEHIGVSWAIGNGISTLIGKNAKFEEAKGIKTRRTLNYLLIEQNMFLKERLDWQVTLRWHHRCHVFGKIAPKRTGSNFFVLGIKYLI